MVTNSQQTSQPISNYLIVPTTTFVPVYLEKLLTDTPRPDVVDMAFLLDLGIASLRAKIQNVEDHNILYKAAKRRIPDKLDFDDVAIILLSLYEFKNVQMTERPDDTLLAVYVRGDNEPKQGIYDTNIKYMFEVMERIAPNFKNRDMQDVLDKIERSVESVPQTHDRHLFIVKNGIYNQATKELIPFSPEYVYLTKIPVDYKYNPINPTLIASDGYKWDVESWIAELAEDKDVETLMWQVIADCLQPQHSRHKSIWFYSEKGNNGKGTIGQLIKNLLGKGNYSSLAVADFNHEFLKETLLGVAANISDENDVDVFIDSIKDYKASITGDDININRKYEKPLRIQFLGTNIQMMNGLPKTKDKSESFYRRLILVPFIKSFTNNGERKYIKDVYIHDIEVLEFVLNKTLDMQFDDYIIPQSSAELMDSYREKNNPVLEFWNELKEEFVWDLLPAGFLYDLFIQWHDMNNPSGRVMSSRTFNDTLKGVIHSQNEPWEVKTGQNDKVRTLKKMDADEPLISEFGLDRPNKAGKRSAWVHTDYAGDNASKLRDFKRKDMYRGYTRM